MTIRHAACHCGQLRLTSEGEPVRISVCHCSDCQRRTGSPFGFSAHYPRAQITAIEGRHTAFTRKADSDNTVTFHFCPDCGSNVYWEPSGHPERITVAVGNYGDPDFPAPRHSVYETRKHHWVQVPEQADHRD
ncbi:MAG TPA: GFA family protein [Rhizomicrobium sp.]